VFQVPCVYPYLQIFIEPIGTFDEHKSSKDHILFLHAFSGCDTTSALFNKGKTATLKLLEKRQDLQVAAQVFNRIDFFKWNTIFPGHIH